MYMVKRVPTPVSMMGFLSADEVHRVPQDYL